MARVLEPEWLDDMPPGDARAVRSRGDLVRVNAVMGNARLIHSVLAEHAVRRVADLGAGDGALMAKLRKRNPALQPVLVDRLAFPGVLQADAVDFLSQPGPRYDAIVANLFLHHLAPDELARLLRLASQRCRLFVACEPRRSRVALAACALLPLLGCNAVTRHDARVSVRAGFAGRELSQAWPGGDGWRLEERAALPFSHLFIAHAL